MRFGYVYDVASKKNAFSFNNNLIKSFELSFEGLWRYWDYNFTVFSQEIAFYNFQTKTHGEFSPFIEGSLNIDFDLYKRYLPSSTDDYTVIRQKAINIQRWVPTVGINLSFGRQPKLKQNYLISRLTLRNKFIFTKAGELYSQIVFSKIWGDLLTEKLLNGGRYAAGEAIFFGDYRLQTLRANEFIQEELVLLFLRYNLTGATWKFKYSQPALSLAQNIGFGRLKNNPTNFKTMEKGFYESGILVQNLIQLPLLDVGFLGSGIGAYWRWGAYRLDNTPFIKLDLQFVF